MSELRMEVNTNSLVLGKGYPLIGNVGSFTKYRLQNNTIM